MFAENLDAFVQDFGSPAIFKSQHALVLFDEPDEGVLGGRAQSKRYKITYRATELTGLANEDAVTVGVDPDDPSGGWRFNDAWQLIWTGCLPPLPQAKTFKVLGSPRLLDNGAFMEADLKAVS